MNRFVVFSSRLVTCDPERSSAGNPLGVIVDGALLVEDGRIAAVGTRDEVALLAGGATVLADDRGHVTTPGLIDAHTHLAWVGSRHDEYVLRMQGAGYEAIAAAGGGIVSSMRAVRSAEKRELVEHLTARLARMASLGTTTCEIKSGYGLDLASERKQLQAIHEVASAPRLPRVIPTWLALHALPPEGREDRAAWTKAVAERWTDEIASDGIATFVDAYIDRNAFSVDEARPVFERAVQRGMGVRAHIGQFADVGGAELAAQVGAASVDHVENISEPGLAALAMAGTRAVLLPVASFTLRQAPPPIAAMRRAGVPIVVASDANPGTAPTESLPLALAFALHTYGLTPQECILGATREAAMSVGLGDTCGRLAPGFSADFVLWDLPHEHALLQPWGSPMTRKVVARGELLFDATGM